MLGKLPILSDHSGWLKAGELVMDSVMRFANPQIKDIKKPRIAGLRIIHSEESITLIQ